MDDCFGRFSFALFLPSVVSVNLAMLIEEDGGILTVLAVGTLMALSVDGAVEVYTCRVEQASPLRPHVACYYCTGQCCARLSTL